MRFLSWRPGQANSGRVCAECPEPSEPRRPARLEHHISTGLRRLSVLCGTGLRRTGAALELGLFAATGFAAGAEAQSVLVSNDGQSDASVGSGGIIKLDSYDIGQSFQTGGNSNGYTLSSVVIDFAKLGDRDVIASKLTASINARSSTGPGALIGTLTASRTSRNVLTFSAGSSGISLEANTIYFFTIDVTEALDGNNRLRIAASTAADAGGAANWLLSGGKIIRDNSIDGASWAGLDSSNSEVSSLPFKITINGEVNTPGVTITSAALEVAEGGTAIYDVVLDTAPTGDVEITPTSSATANATVSPATLTFTSTNWNQAQQVKVTGVAAGSASISHQVTSSADTTNYPTSMSIDPVVVTIEGSGAALILKYSTTNGFRNAPEGSTTRYGEFFLSPQRLLGSGETVTVPLSFSGGNLGTDFTVSIDPDHDFASATLSASTVTFTGPSQGGNPLKLRLFALDDDDTDDEVVTVSVGAATSTGGPVTPDLSGNRIGNAQITLLDDDVSQSLTVEFTRGAYSVDESGGPVEPVLRLSAIPRTDIAVTVTVTDGTAVRGEDYVDDATRIVTFLAGRGASNPTGSFQSKIVDDDEFEPDETFTVAIDTGSLPAGVTGKTGGNLQATVTIFDDDTTLVSLARVGSGAVTEGDTAEFTVTLGRALAAGEIIDVPLSVSGTGVTTDDWSLALKTGAGRNTGVVLSGETTATPSLRFSGAAAQTATLVLTATPDEVTETGGETLSVALGPDGMGANGFDRSELGTNVGGGADPDASANAFTLQVTEPSVISITDGPEPAVVEGADATFVILANPAPESDLEVSLSIADAAGSNFLFADDAGDTMMTIPAGQSSVVYRVRTKDDSKDESNGAVTVTITDDNRYTVLSSAASATVDITDDDPTSVSLSVLNDSVDEGRASDTAAIKLTLGRELVPGEILTVPLQFSGGTLGTEFTLALSGTPDGVALDANTGVVTFTGGDPVSAKGVRVLLTALEDDDAVSESVTVTIPASDMDTGTGTVLTATGLGGGAAGSVSGSGVIALADDDEAGVTVTETILNVEEGRSRTYQVVLTSEPTHDVTIAVTSGDTNVATVDSDALTFTSGNWNDPQTVTVTGMDDAEDRRVSISHVATSDDSTYSGIVASVSVMVTEQSIISITGGSGPAVAEGAAATFVVLANPAPASDLEVSLIVGEVTGSDFVAAGNKGGDKTVTIPAGQSSAVYTVNTKDDSTDEADGAVTVLLAPSPGSLYMLSSSAASATVDITDDDPTSVSLSVRDNSADEARASDTAAIKLTLGRELVPGEILTVPLQFSGGTLGTEFTLALSGIPDGVTLDANTGVVTFTGGDPVSAKGARVLLTALEDDDAVDERVTVTIPASSDMGSAPVLTATGLGGGAAGSVSGSGVIELADDDEVGVTVTETILNVEEGGSGTYTLELDTVPTHDVTIAVTSGDPDVATVDSDTLTFTLGNWNQPQTVTVTGLDDDIDQSVDQTVSISHVATSEDPNYDGIGIDGVDVTVLDDDMPAIGFEKPVSRTRETAGQHEIALSLDPVPGQNIMLAYSIGVESTATQDSDFTIVNAGRVSVLAGASRALLPLGIVDDTLVEGDETVILTLENGSGYSPGEAAQHVLTIIDDGDAERVVRPALARFGRTVGEQVLDAVTDRLGAARTPGFEGRFAGEALPDVICDDGKSAPDHVLEDDDRRRKCVGQGRYEPGSGRPADPSVSAWSNGLTGGPGGTPEVQAKETSDILPGTSFALTSETENGAALAFWGRGAQSGFSGRAGDLGLEGEVTSFMLGADQARGDWLFGLMLSRSRGGIDYSLGAASGEMETDLTALVPYMGWDVSDRLSVWGAAGLGSGDMRLRPEDGPEFRTDIDWGMAAAGADGALGSVAALGGAELGWLADALWTRTTSDAVPGLEATSGSTTSGCRLGLESRWERAALPPAATLSPRLETGLRYDGGDAETGFGLEVGGGVEFTDPSRGLSLGLRGRTLALHQDGNFEDWGLALDLAYDPTPETKRGFAARLSHTFGGASSGGVDALLGPRLFPEASPTGGGDRSWSVEAAYGVSRGRGRVGSPYTTITAAGSGSATGARLGYRIEPDADHAADVNLDFWTEPPTSRQRPRQRRRNTAMEMVARTAPRSGKPSSGPV